MGACGTDSPVRETDTGLAGMTSSPAPKADKAQDQATLRASAAKAMQRDASEAYAAVGEGAGRFSVTNAAQRMSATVDRAGLVMRWLT